MASKVTTIKQSASTLRCWRPWIELIQGGLNSFSTIIAYLGTVSKQR